MSRGTVISLYILAAFVVFVTQRGELPAYLGYLFGASKPAVGGTQAAAASGPSASDVASVVNAAGTVAESLAVFGL